MPRKKILSALLLLLFTFTIIGLANFIFLLKYFGSGLENNPPRIDCSASWCIRWIDNYFKRKMDPSWPHNSVDASSLYAYDKTLGWNLKPNTKLKDKGISINSKGLRGLKEYPYNKPFGRKRIAVIGDSFVFGAEHNDNEIFPYLIDKMLPNIDVLNLGVGGYGHDQILLKLKKEGIRYAPDIVILFFAACNIDRNIVTFRDYAKPRYILKEGKLVLKNVPVATPEEVIRKEIFKIPFGGPLAISSFLIKKRLGLIDDEKIKLTRALLKEMKNLCEKINSKFIIAYLINEKGYILKTTEKEMTLLPVNISDLRDLEGHWTNAGHKLVAKEIFKGLLRLGLTKPGELSDNHS